MSRITQREAGEFIKNRLPFVTHGALCAVDYSGTGGRLPAGWASKLNQSQYAAPNGSVYAVMSYNTPIAWYCPVMGWVVPDVQHSQTTSRHQSIMRRAVREARS